MAASADDAENLHVTVDFSDQYMNCGTSIRMTWSQVDNLILSQLGSNGITKQEFENTYYLDVEGIALTAKDDPSVSTAIGDGYDILPSLAGQDFVRNEHIFTAPSGNLYTDAAANAWWAKRYTADGFGYAVGQKTEGAALGKLNNFTNTSNWFGRVWYTPHNSSTDPQAWDGQTNVLVWDIQDYIQGNMNKARYERLRDIVGVTYASRGTSTKDLSTTVRFINKTNNSSIFVTLRIPAGKLHFEYGEISNKNWSYWFEFNSVKAGSSSSASPYWTEFDTRINPFNPYNVNYRFLDVTDFNNQLTNFWTQPSGMLSWMGAYGRFSKFTSTGAISVNFTLTHPVMYINSTISANKGIKIDGVQQNNVYWWKVKGASSDMKGYTEWTLVVGAHGVKWSPGNTAIFAVQKDGAAYASEEVAYLAEGTESSTVNEKLIFHGIETADDLYPAATSLVNYMGAYDAAGNQRFNTTSNELTNLTSAYFLEDNIDRAFTAYVKIHVAHTTCYDPLVGKQYLNVRFHRPINVVAKEIEWKEYCQNNNYIDVKDLIEVVDWNCLPVVPYNNPTINADKSKFGMNFPKYADVYGGSNTVKQQTLGVPYEFYGIQELAIRYGEIRTDLLMSQSVRDDLSGILSDLTNKTAKISSVPALVGSSEPIAGYKTITLLNADGTIAGWSANDYNLSNYNASTPGQTSYGRIYFNCDGLDTELFHIFVPIAVKYNWGNIAYDKNLGTPAKLDKDYTQVVWAIITVRPETKQLYINDVSTCHGTQVILPVQLENNKTIAGFQFDVTLPDGIQYVKYEKTSRMSSHSVSTNMLSDNKIRFLVSIIGEQEIAVGTGTVLNLTVSIPATYTAGNYTVTVSNIELTHNEGNNVETINQSDATSKLTVIAAKPGDANGDNKVSVTDVTSIINYILQKIPSTFIFEAADVNGDKKISVTDVTMTINIVLGKTSANARKRDEDNEVEPE